MPGGGFPRHCFELYPLIIVVFGNPGCGALSTALIRIRWAEVVALLGDPACSTHRLCWATLDFVDRCLYIEVFLIFLKVMLLLAHGLLQCGLSPYVL